MTPARRRILERIKRGGEKKPRFNPKKLLAAVLLMVGFFVFIKTQTRVWNGEDKVSVAVFDKDRVVVATFDPGAQEITSIIIPGETQVDSARELGTFRIKNIWRLGENEKIGGVLLSETVTKNFKFPTGSWADAPALAYSTGETAKALGIVFKSFSTNLGIGDKLAMALFSLRVKNTNRVEIDLAKTGYLKEAKLLDGESGYLVSGKPPQELAAIFADPQIARGSIRIEIINETGEASDPEAVAQILEVIGGKVSSLVKGDIQDYDCTVLGANRSDIKKIAKVLGCNREDKAPEGNFDLEVRLGKRFAERF
jgi:hypothetical protein